MNQSRLDEILMLEPAEAVKALMVSSYSIPKWVDLEKQYNPLKHAIMTDKVRYPDKKEGEIDIMKRIPIGLQKLAVDRVSQSEFVTPVDRIYSYDKTINKRKTASEIIEDVYRVKNNIDASNIERAKMLNATCQMATLWYTDDEKTFSKDLESKFSLKHTSYSELDGYSIFANIDDKKRLLVVSIYSEDSEDTKWLNVYTGGTRPSARVYSKLKDGDWELVGAPQYINILPISYTNTKQPAWGGMAGTIKVEEIEEIYCYQGVYVKKNAAPLFVVDDGDTAGMIKDDLVEDKNDARKIAKVGKKGSIKAVVWESNNETVKAHLDRNKSAFFEELQIPDMSHATMIASNTSVENKDLIFADARAKAVDLGGEWIKLFNDELKIVISFLKIMYPEFADDFDKISIISKINPYNVRSLTERADVISKAGEAMSLQTKVKELDLVNNVNEEVELINQEVARENNM